jgi:nickel-dependent lactate racemase
MKIHLDYDRNGLDVQVPDRNLLAVLAMNRAWPLRDPGHAVPVSLEVPIGSRPLSEIARGKRTACVVVSDITRPVPNKVILPPLLRALERAGIARSHITLLIATGLHRPNEGAEIVEMLGAGIARRYRVVNHVGKDPSTHRFLGRTPTGLPIHVDKTYLDADLKITTGLIEPHLMAGYSGGRKSILPGIASVDSVRPWHSPKYIESPTAVNGNLADNLVHEEAVAAAKMAGVDFIVNVVMNEKRKVLGVFSGDLDAAFAEGVKRVDKVVKVRIPERADLVITTSAGYPLDLTYYQAIKGVVGALPAVKEGGTILMAAGLTEGLGGPEYTGLVGRFKSLADFMREVMKPDFFCIDQWQLEELDMVKRKADVWVFSRGLSRETLSRCFVTPLNSVEEGISKALAKYGPDMKIVAIPKGPYVIPVVEDGSNQ